MSQLGPLTTTCLPDVANTSFPSGQCCNLAGEECKHLPFVASITKEVFVDAWQLVHTSYLPMNPVSSLFSCGLIPDHVNVLYKFHYPLSIKVNVSLFDLVQLRRTPPPWYSCSNTSGRQCIATRNYSSRPAKVYKPDATGFEHQLCDKVSELSWLFLNKIKDVRHFYYC